MERYLWLSSMRYGAEWLTRPLVIVIGIITIMSILAGLRAGGYLRSKFNPKAVEDD